MFYKNGALKTLEHFTGKYIARVSFFIKLQNWGLHFFKNEIFKDSFLQNTSGQLLLKTLLSFYFRDHRYCRSVDVLRELRDELRDYRYTFSRFWNIKNKKIVRLYFGRSVHGLDDILLQLISYLVNWQSAVIMFLFFCWTVLEVRSWNVRED